MMGEGVLRTPLEYQGRLILYHILFGMLFARFVKVYRSLKLCRNIRSHNSCGNASGISHAYKGCGNAICHFINQVHECQNFALILGLVPLMQSSCFDFKWHNILVIDLGLMEKAC